MLQDVSVTIEGGQVLGLQAPSGFGKSTLCRVLAGFLKPQKGQVLLDGTPLPARGASPVQLVYQHPEKAVNPRWRMKQVLEEAGQIDPHLLERLGLEQEWLNRYPGELSGGELQRFCLARALREGTRFLLADEISTMLDVITQAQIWRAVLDTAAERKIGILAVTHNEALAEQICTDLWRPDYFSGE